MLSGSEQKQVDEILALVGDVLGPDTVGAYLHGSAALGGLRPRSDIDVLVVSRRPTTRAEKGRLVERLFTISGRTDPLEAKRPIELTIVVESEIRPWRYPPTVDFQYGEWLRGAFESGNVEPWSTPNPDLASLITMVLLADTPLTGPPPAEIFDPVPRRDLVSAMVGGIDELLRDLSSDTTNVLLTLARMWSTVERGAIRSKDAAADWALGRLPEEHRAVLARARAVYLGGEDDRWDDVELRLRPHVDHVVAEIQRSAPR